MNWDQIEGNWGVFKGKLREKWGELTDDELDQMKGQRDRLLGTIQAKYGESREQVEREMSELVDRLQ
ncbi:MAG: hypothetical protein AMXMBFR82_52430 [Candidatus Hydrogenedentota bacterium]